MLLSYAQKVPNPVVVDEYYLNDRLYKSGTVYHRI